MTVSTDRAREPRGAATGGRFAPEAKAEPDLNLARVPDRVDDDGFPASTCPNCAGRGNARAHSRDLGHSTCFNCRGTGLVYSPEVFAQVRELARARAAAARPLVRELRTGNLVSRAYRDPSDARWRRVADVLVFPDRPVPSPIDPKRHAYAAIIVFDDGEQMRTTTETTVARRGEDVDPEPFVAAAAGRRAYRGVSRRR